MGLRAWPRVCTGPLSLWGARGACPGEVRASRTSAPQLCPSPQTWSHSPTGPPRPHLFKVPFLTSLSGQILFPSRSQVSLQSLRPTWGSRWGTEQRVCSASCCRAWAQEIRLLRLSALAPVLFPSRSPYLTRSSAGSPCCLW